MKSIIFNPELHVLILLGFGLAFYILKKNLKLLFISLSYQFLTFTPLPIILLSQLISLVPASVHRPYDALVVLSGGTLYISKNDFKEHWLLEPHRLLTGLKLSQTLQTPYLVFTGHDERKGYFDGGVWHQSV